MTIDDNALSAALHDYAEKIDVPDGAADRLLGRSPVTDGRGSGHVDRNRRLLAIAAALAAVVGVGSVVTSMNQGDKQDSATSRTTGPTETSVGDETANAGVRDRSPSALSGAGFGGGGNRGDSEASTSTTRAATGTSTANTPSGQNYATGIAADRASRLIRTGDVDILVKRGRLEQSIDRVAAIANGAGGFVADSQTREAGRTPAGTLRIRVPSAAFDKAIESLRDIGKVTALNTRGVDVSGEYTDNESRLRALTATREQFYSVLAKASAIGDILAVQDRINNLQVQIEQIQGRQQVLDNQTALGTLSVTVHERAPKVVKKPEIVAPKPKTGIAGAWERAKTGFGDRIEGIVAHSGSFAVLLAALLLALFAVKLAWPHLRRALL